MSRLLGNGKVVSATERWGNMFEVTLLLGVKFNFIYGSDFSTVQFSLIFGMSGNVLPMILD